MMRTLLTSILIVCFSLTACQKETVEAVPEISDTFTIRNMNPSPQPVQHTGTIEVNTFESRDSSIILTNYSTRQISYQVRMFFSRPLKDLQPGTFKIVDGVPSAKEVAIQYRYISQPNVTNWSSVVGSELRLGRINGKIWVSVPEIQMQSATGDSALYLSVSAREH